MTIILRVFVAAVLLALMSLSGVNAARAVLHGADSGAHEPPSGLIKSVATHAADPGDQ